MADERKDRKEELLATARERLTQERPVDSGPKLRYRGQVIRHGGGATPGSVGIALPQRLESGGRDDVRGALQKIKGLYRDGLISRTEAEKKRSEVLDRL